LQEQGVGGKTMKTSASEGKALRRSLVWASIRIFVVLCNIESLLQNKDFRSKSRHAKNFTAGM
jgi:hypothetical protein